jgi:hypothetical protein
MRLSWWDGKRWVLAFDVLLAAGLTVLPFLKDNSLFFTPSINVMVASYTIASKKGPRCPTRRPSSC